MRVKKKATCSQRALSEPRAVHHLPASCCFQRLAFCHAAVRKQGATHPLWTSTRVLREEGLICTLRPHVLSLARCQHGVPTCSGSSMLANLRRTQLVLRDRAFRDVVRKRLYGTRTVGKSAHRALRGWLPNRSAPLCTSWHMSATSVRPTKQLVVTYCPNARSANHARRQRIMCRTRLSGRELSAKRVHQAKARRSRLHIPLEKSERCQKERLQNFLKKHDYLMLVRRWGSWKVDAANLRSARLAPGA